MPAPALPLRARVEGAIWGLLVGDALGVPFEFKRASELPSPSSAIDFALPPSYHRSHPLAPPYAWSDDGAQSLALLHSLLDCDALDLTDFGSRLLKWYRHGAYAKGGVVFDIGMTTHVALGRLGKGFMEAGMCGLPDEFSNGNGSLMRVLPLALWHDGDDESLVENAMRQSCVTHRHLRAQLCCALHCLWARRVLRGKTPRAAWSAAVFRLRGLAAGRAPWEHELSVILAPDGHTGRGGVENDQSTSSATTTAADMRTNGVNGDDGDDDGDDDDDCLPKGSGSSYVVDCLLSARAAVLAGGGYCDVVRAAVGLGGDTDTTACVAGGVAGLVHGVEAVPSRWREQMGGEDIVRPLVERLVAHVEASEARGWE